MLNEITKNKLQRILNEAVSEGYLTQTAADNGISHSLGFLLFKPEAKTFLTSEVLAVDLGTGGGLPGVVLSTLTECRGILLDRGKRRNEFLQWAVKELEPDPRRPTVCQLSRISISSGRKNARASVGRSFVLYFNVLIKIYNFVSIFFFFLFLFLFVKLNFVIFPSRSFI